MEHPIPTTALLIAFSFVAAIDQDLRADTKQPVSPPTLTKLDEAMVMAILPDERLIGVFSGSGPDGQEAIARYSSDGGRTWSGPEMLFRLPKDMGVWGLHYVLADHSGELHLFYTTDAKTTGKGLYEMRFDIYHVGSAKGRTSWSAAGSQCARDTMGPCCQRSN